MLNMTKFQRWCERTKYNNDQTMIAASTVYSMGNGKSIFAAYSQGYNPTGPSNVEPDESDNFEIGYRSSQPGSYLEVVVSLLIMTT